MESTPATLTLADAAGQILLDGLSDWVELDMARQYVQDAHPAASRAQLRRLTIDTVAWLLAQELVVAGDLRPRFEAWPSSPAESSARIEREWSDPDERLGLGAVCWLHNTPAGDEVGRRLDAD